MFGILIGSFGAGLLSKWFKKERIMFGGTGLFLSNGHYVHRNVSDWVVKHIVGSEGYRENAYAATDYEKKVGQYTIGHGTSYLFNADGTPFNNGYAKGYKKGGNGVRPTDTLSGLKKSMGYSHLTSKEFAVQLIKNYLMGNSVSSFLFLKKIESEGVYYFSKVKEALLEFSYGSNSIHVLAIKKDEYKDFVSALKSGSVERVASAYAMLRYKYYKENTAKVQWNRSKLGWMARVYSASMYIKGVEVSNPLKTLGYIRNNATQTMKNYAIVFKRDLGIDINMA